MGHVMLNMDFLKEILIDTEAQAWHASPMTGVWRKPLAREEAERGHATSIVRYDPGSFFRAHPHPGGEEIFVLKGVFSDESGDYHAGTYFRNPPGTSHAPHSKDGCELLVKLHQFSRDDRAQVSINTYAFSDSKTSVQLLHEHLNEKVYCLKLTQHTDLDDLVDIIDLASVEVLVLAGSFQYRGNQLKKGSWLRLPNFQLDLVQLNNNVVLWCKTGHF